MAIKKETFGSVPDACRFKMVYNVSVKSAVGLLAAQRRLPIETDSDYWTVCTRCGQCEVACLARDEGVKDKV